MARRRLSLSLLLCAVAGGSLHGRACAQMDEKYQPNAESKKYPVGVGHRAPRADGRHRREPRLHPQVRPQRPARLQARRASRPARCASAATTTSATRRWADGGRKPSKSCQPGIKSSTTCRPPPTPSPAYLRPCRHRHHPRAKLLRLPRLPARSRATRRPASPSSPAPTTSSAGRTTWSSSSTRPTRSTKISLTQLDGIFGSRRAGGWVKARLAPGVRARCRKGHPHLGPGRPHRRVREAAHRHLRLQPALRHGARVLRPRAAVERQVERQPARLRKLRKARRKDVPRSRPDGRSRAQRPQRRSAMCASTSASPTT